MDLKNILLNAVNIAAQVQKNYLKNKKFDVEVKYGGNVESASDLVTSADIKSEEVLREYFSKTLPEFNIFGEEGGAEYNGNGKVIVIDPIDGTKSFVHRLPGFGPIIGIFDNGINIAGVEYNVLRDVMHIATASSGFEAIGKENVPDNALYFGGFIKTEEKRELLERIVNEEFPNHPLIIDQQDIINKSRVCSGKWAAYFHPGLACHDVAAIRIFGKITGTIVSDDLGNFYPDFHPETEVKKYLKNEKKELYSNNLLVVKPQHFEKMLKIIDNFKEDF